MRNYQTVGHMGMKGNMRMDRLGKNRITQTGRLVDLINHSSLFGFFGFARLCKVVVCMTRVLCAPNVKMCRKGWKGSRRTRCSR